MTFTRQILLGLFSGVALGIFLGEMASPFTTGGEVFIGLLQMTVLPYIVVSLVANLGRVSWRESRVLLRAAVAVLATLLIFGMVVLLLAPLAFPAWETASFFRSALIEPDVAMDFVALYVPANPFHSLANNIVPAVVLFSILLGVGVSGVPGNRGFLDALVVLEAALNRINKIVIKLTPMGVFAIAAGTAGSISVTELSRLQAYLITYTVVATVLSFIVLPMFVSAVTPFRYRDLVAVPKDTLIMIFATAKIIVLMPQLVANVKDLFRRYELEDEKVDSGAEVLLPLAYPFPNLGTYTILMFVPFAAWYMGRSLDFSDQLIFQGASLLSSFVAPIIGIPFLLDILRLPADVMDLFVMSTVYTDRIRVVLGAVHLFSLTIVAICISRGLFVVQWRRLLQAVVATLLVLGFCLFSIHNFLDRAVDEDYQGDRALVEMRWMDRTVPVKQYRDGLPEALPVSQRNNHMAAIEQRGTLRVGYLPDSLPFAFSNSNAEVVGLDIEMAHMLAADLGVSLTLVRLEKEQIEDALRTGALDIVMSGLAKTASRARRWTFSDSYMDLNLGFLVPDYRRKEFATVTAMRRSGSLRLGVVQSDDALQHLIKTALPEVELVNLRSPREFLRGNRPELDAVAYSAEGGSAWTLVYPAYSVVVPQPAQVRLSAGYPLPPGDEKWGRFVSDWIVIRQKEGTLDALFSHWIMGRGSEDTAPRWSIVRNVLHWID